MSRDECMKATPEIEKIVADATNPEALREALKMELERTGRILSRERAENGMNFTGKEPTAPLFVPSETAAPSERRETFFRVVYPYHDSRFELVGISEEDLDQQEEQIRAMYARKQ